MQGSPVRSALLACTLAALAACGGDGPSGPAGGDDGIAKYTIMVYMAADNNLAVPGIFDLDEMESAGVDPEVQIVVQAEFSPTMLQQYECDASCFNRPNFNTFRYIITGEGATTTGPNGPTTDIGNRNMTLASELTEFVTWAKAQRPAEHYILVLWNHGGGYTGLLQDETSAGNELMSVQAVRTALAGVGKIDIIDFDMCLMGGYETLVKMKDIADVVVFSEEVVPGEGNPYKQWVDAVQAGQNNDPAAVATAMVDAFHGFYASPNHQSSTTKSAYAMAGLTAVETALNTLATTLKAQLATERPNIEAALAGAQKYAYPELTDLVTFLDSLNLKTSNTTIKTQIAAVKTAATASGFRLRNRVRNGSGSAMAGGYNVARSTGMHLVLPSGVGDDRFNNSGPRSYAAYSSLYTGAAWTGFLGDWLGTQTSTDAFDQGSNVFQGFLVWEEEAVAADADVDMWILEPNGNLYIPWMGVVTPNGTLTNDSAEDDTWFEGYLTNRYVQVGRYKFYAHLFQDPEDYRPLYDFQYRFGLSAGLTSAYAPTYPTLSLVTSIMDDATPTFGEIEAGAYTDFQYVLYADLGPVTLQAAAVHAPVLGTAEAGTALRSAGPEITSAQLQRVREALLARRAREATTGASVRTRPDPLTRRVAPAGLTSPTSTRQPEPR